MAKMQMLLRRKRNQDRSYLQNGELREYTEHKPDTPEGGSGMQAVDHLVDRLLVICHGKEIKRFGQCRGGFTDEICNNHGETYHQEQAEADSLDPDRKNESDSPTEIIAVNSLYPRLRHVKR